jgi:hypothetical protein
MKLPFIASSYHKLWSSRIFCQLQLEQFVVQEIIYDDKDLCAQVQKRIDGQREIIFFGSKWQAKNQMKTYLLSPHMLDFYTDTNNLCYNGQKLFTKCMLGHFPTNNDILTWNYHA